MTDLRKWSENAFVMLAGLKESVQWELAPAIMKEIRELVDAYPVGAAPSEGMKADSNLPPEKMTAHNGVAVGLSPARSGEPSAPQTPTVTKQAATCNCYGNDIPHTHAAPQTSAETQLCKCGHHWRKHRYSEFWCDSCECKKFAAAPQPVSGDAPSREVVRQAVFVAACKLEGGTPSTRPLTAAGAEILADAAFDAMRAGVAQPGDDKPEGK